MKKYRKKPVVIEAEQWFPNKEIKGVRVLGSIARIETPEGDLEVSSGDYVITDTEGEKYPCKPDIFEKTYEIAE